MREDDGSSLQLLLAGLVHELNTPVGVIQSNRDVLRLAIGKVTAILADGVVDDEAIEQLRDLGETITEVIEIDQVAVGVISQLVAALRDCWRMDEAGICCVDLRDGIESTLVLLSHEIKHRIDVVKEYEDLPAVVCHPSRTNQVFMNLLLNASQAIEKEGTITIRTYMKNGSAVVEISDTGSGIEPARLAGIFEAGFTTKGEKSETGMGLRISREIIEQQGGAIEAESIVGKGSTFRVMLPVEQSSLPAVEA
jgi:signal transduction histidine kinase